MFSLFIDLVFYLLGELTKLKGKCQLDLRYNFDAHFNHREPTGFLV